MNAIETSHSEGSEERLVAFDEVIRITANFLDFYFS